MNLLEKYAHLLVNYCLELKAGERLYVVTTMLGEPLAREVYLAGLRVGAHVFTEFTMREQSSMFMVNATEEELRRVPPFYKHAIEEFEAYLFIRAPYNLREGSGTDAHRSQIRNDAMRDIQRVYSERTATRGLRRNLCQFPTDAAAQEAGMGLEEYTKFVFGACKLFADDPISEWLNVRAKQQHVTDHLNSCETVRYVTHKTDITFSTKGRKWINSDGQTNMPSGEVYTSPVEDAVNGVVHFTLPCLYQGNEVEGVTLWVKDGYIERWEAKRGQAFLDYIFTIPGTRRFGEAAIGTNYDIKRMTKNILFDEKIGGTIHMAIGQSYLLPGGKNESAVHWDMITDMTNGGYIEADGVKIYENGVFII